MTKQKVRYIVVQVGCLECSGGKAEPEVVYLGEDYDEACRIAALDSKGSSSDSFVINLNVGHVVYVND